MTKTEILIEAISYAEENGSDWWESFDSFAEAKKILYTAAKEIPDESQIVCMLSARNCEDIYENYTPEDAYDKVIRDLKRELKEAREEEE